VQLVAAISDPSPYPLAFTVLGCNLLALLVFMLVQRRSVQEIAAIVVPQAAQAAPGESPQAEPLRTRPPADAQDRQGQLF
jgi:hypothetical protein